MPSPLRQLTVQGARDLIGQRAVPEHAVGRGRVGLECEWLAYDAADASAPVDLSRVQRAVRSIEPLASGARVSYEPGGQVELSGVPGPTVGAACRTMADDIRRLEHALAREGVVLAGAGIDRVRRPSRVVDTPRYRAMEGFFDADGEDGRRMMCATAAVQVNLDVGARDDADRRWQLAHAVSPTLAAMFANSPVTTGRTSGWRSMRLATWWAIDPSRSAPVGGERLGEAWAAYALSARVMLIRVDDRDFHPVTRRLRFVDWVAHGHELGHPTEDDLDYHLGTLFPPVRPRGWLELRVIDALPDPWWRVAAAVATAVLDHEDVATVALGATKRTAGLWREAAYLGLVHPDLADSARRCFVAVLAALPELGADPETEEACANFFDRYTARGRCPADDLLDEWRAGLAPVGAGLPRAAEREASLR